MIRGPPAGGPLRVDCPVHTTRPYDILASAGVGTTLPRVNGTPIRKHSEKLANNVQPRLNMLLSR